MPISARIISTGSNKVPRSRAAATPMAIASTTQSTAAPNTSDRVAGAAAAISGTTSRPWFEYDTRLRVTKSCFIIRRYWTGSGRLSPNEARISASVCGLGLRPASARAGSTPGVLKKIKKVSTVITNMTSTVHRSRRTMNVSIGPPPPGRPPLSLYPQLGARVEGVPDAIPQHVQGQHGEHDHDPGCERHPGPGVQEVLAVAD